MKAYMVRLKGTYTEGTKQELIAEGMAIIHHDAILPNFIIVETNATLAELKQHPLFKSVEEPRVGRVDI